MADQKLGNQQARLTPPELIELIRQRHSSDKNTSAVLVAHLNRSDRLDALGQQPFAKHVLAEIARRTQNLLRTDDRYCIVSPNEIWILLCDLPSEALAELAGKSLRDSLQKPIEVDKGNGDTKVVLLRPHIGAGWAPATKIGNPLTLINTAAEASTTARNSDEHICLKHLESDDAIEERDALERDLRVALQANELTVFYQPQIDFQTGECISTEALIRWFREDNERSVNPGLIASICEERGMMAQLTQYVLNTSLRNLMFWREADIDISVAVNLSAVTLSDEAFPEFVEQTLATWGVPGDKLLLELTESAIVQNEVSAIEFMQRLKTLGCKLAIDDFGTGYSSFSYLRQFPLDELKIDQSFVRDVATDTGDKQIVGALIGLAHTFEMHALAEGIESPEAIAVLKELGCDRGQGFHYAKPMAAEDFPEWFEAHQSANKAGDQSVSPTAESLDHAQ